MRLPSGSTGLALAVLVLGAMGPAAAEAQDDHEWALGTWSGTLEAGPQRIEVVYHIAETAEGTLTGTMDVPTQGATGIPLTTVDVDDRKITVTFPVPGGGTYEGTVDDRGETVTGTFTQAGQSFPMNLGRSEGASRPPLRPQMPVAPYPYSSEDVVFPNAQAGIELAGTITVPDGEDLVPGVVLVSGSGPQNRDEELAGHKPFLVLADHLARAGIAVLRYDDRGVAESGGEFGTATSDDFASDAIAATVRLGMHPRVDPARVGIVGHSEGGLVGPLAASRSDDVRFVVLLAGPALPGLDILVAQGELINRVSGTPEVVTQMNTRLQRRMADIIRNVEDPAEAAPLLEAAMRAEIASLPDHVRTAAGSALDDDAITQTVQQMNSPWLRNFLHYDPRPALESLDVPVLALFGAKDLQVPAELNASEMTAVFARSGHKDATVRVLPELNHLFQEATTGSPEEYAAIEQTFSPVALETVSAWISSRFGR